MKKPFTILAVHFFSNIIKCNKMQLLLIFILTLIAYQSESQVIGNDIFLHNEFIVNPYNDKEVYFIGKTELSNSILCKVDLTNNICLNYDIDEGVLRASYNDFTKYLALVKENSIKIINIVDMKTIANINCNFSLQEKVSVEFSKDGKNILVFNENTLNLKEYQVITGSLLNDFYVDSNPKFYNNSFINSNKMEFCLAKNDSLEIWSVETKKHVRTIKFLNNQYQFIKCLDGGNYISALSNSNSIILINYSTGEISLNITTNPNVTNYDFSSNLKYVYFCTKDDGSEVYDISGGKIVNISNIINFDSVEKKIYFLKSDLKNFIVSQKHFLTCEANSSMPSLVNVKYIYDCYKQKIATFIPSGFCGNIDQVIIDKRNEHLAISGTFKPLFKNIVNIYKTNNDFVKSITSIGQLLDFSFDSKYLIFTDSNKVLFYNIEKDSLEKTIVTDINYIMAVKFLEFNTDQVIIFNSEQIRVYSISDLKLLNTYDLKSKDLSIHSHFVYVNDKLKFKSKKNILHTYDPLKNIIEDRNLNYQFDNNKICDISNDGKYFLYRVSLDSFFVYDIMNNKIIYEHKLKYFILPIVSSSLGFLGNHKMIWFIIQSNIYEISSQIFFIDLTSNKYLNYIGNYNIEVSQNGKNFVVNDCFHYYFGLSPLPVSVDDSNKYNYDEYSKIEVNMSNNTIKLLTENQINSVSIYSMNGIKILSSGNIINNKFDISNLPNGFYFIQFDNKIEKFIIMR